MPRVLCTRPNAAELISDVKFEKTETGMLSEEIADDVAAAFTEIPGYVLVEDASKAKALAAAAAEAAAASAAAEEAAAEQKAVDEAKAAAAEQKAAELKTLTARAVELGIDIKANWKSERLSAEIARAEEAAADAAADAAKNA